jgi:peptidyl-prolyl cis-trans isomerase C
MTTRPGPCEFMPPGNSNPTVARVTPPPTRSARSLAQPGLAVRGLALLSLALASPVLASPVLASPVLADPVLASPVHAAGTPDVAQAQARTLSLLSNPAGTMAAMANHLDRDPKNIVLTVETLPITQADVANVIRTLPVSLASLGVAEIYRRAMDVLVRQDVMVHNARKLGLDKDPAVIQKAKAAIDRVLADEWLSRQADAAVTEAALHARYDRDIAGKPGPEEVRARLILAATEAEARALIEKARDGADFGDLARQFSKDPTAPDGGDLGFVPIEAVAPEVGSAMFALAPGQITPYPVHGLAGYFILRVEGRRQRATPTFDEASDKLAHDLRIEAVKDTTTSLLKEIKFTPGTKPDTPQTR